MSSTKPRTVASPDPDVNPDSNSNPRPKSNSDPGSSPYSRHLPGPKSHQSNTWSNPELVQNIKTEEQIKKEECNQDQAPLENIGPDDQKGVWNSTKHFSNVGATFIKPKLVGINPQNLKDHSLRQQIKRKNKLPIGKTFRKNKTSHFKESDSRQSRSDPHGSEGSLITPETSTDVGSTATTSGAEQSLRSMRRAAREAFKVACQLSLQELRKEQGVL